MNLFTHLIRITAVAGANTLVILDLAFWGTATQTRTQVGVATILVLYLALARQSTAWRATADRTLRASRSIRAAVGLTALLGLCWGVLLISLCAKASPGQQSLLYGISVGAIASAALFSPLSVAFAFWLPVTASAFGSLLATHRSIDVLIAACLSGYALLTAASIVYLNRKAIERWLSEIRLEEQRELIALLLRDFEESSSDWLWETNAAHELTHVSDRMAEAAQLPADVLRNRSLLVWIADPACEAALRLRACLARHAAFRDIVLPIRIDAAERWWSLAGKPILDAQGAFIGYRGVGSDVTAVRQSEEQIAFLARYDSLTGLPNRVLFRDALQVACDGAARQGTEVALLCLDLDEFKGVNDTLGHALGDALLVAVADRLRDCAAGAGTVARLGGDEFAVVTPGLGAAAAVALARRIIQRLSEPYQLEGIPVVIGASIGIALAPRDSVVPGELMRYADLALYRVKSSGRGRLCFFEPELDAHAQARNALRADLQLALSRAEFVLHYQPIVNLATTEVEEVEALLRWLHPERGMIPPTEFIALAEESGAITAIGRWVLHEACLQAARWPASVRVAVNLSPVQFRSQALLESVDSALAASGLPPGRLELEITESLFLEASQATLVCLHALRARGVRIALDDFGTGYSSLSYLRSFPFDKIKIDRSFIRDLDDNGVGAAIIRAITGLAGSLGMITTGEGVETEEQVAMLAECGCTQGQGFLFGRPLGVSEVSRLMPRHRRVAGEAGPGDHDSPQPRPRAPLPAG